MSNTPNYGWDTPDNTGLVKNGALDMRTLGNAIDTSVWNVGFGQAGKNKVINGDFSVWQRGTSFTSPSFADYLADRWRNNNYNVAPTTYSFTRQSFTPGTAPVSGYESAFFARSTITTVGSNAQYDTFSQRVEDVRTFAGQTATLSFWAKSDSTRTQQIYVGQNFGSGGSGEVTVNNYGTNNISTTTSWQRFTLTLSIPSISGKTVGTNNFLYMAIRQASASGSVLDLWGVQWEAGSIATPFQTASGGSIQGELAMCQRYFNRLVSGTLCAITTAQAIGTTGALGTRSFPIMRTGPTVTVSAVGHFSLRSATNSTLTATGFNFFNSSSPQSVTIYFDVASGLVAGNATEMYSSNASATLDLSAEL
jgi:hypothetical protein